MALNPKLDKYQNQAELLALIGRCDGECETHQGNLNVFRVIDAAGHDWGWFSLCEEAVKENEKRKCSMFSAEDLKDS